MKQIILISLCWCTACAQPNNSKNDKVMNGPEIFNCKYVQLIEDTLIMKLIQNVVINYGDLYVEADSALLDKPEQTVTAYGIKKAKFKGNDLSLESYKDSIRYKKGDARINGD
jgi:hypothetical protein